MEWRRVRGVNWAVDQGKMADSRAAGQMNG